MRENRRFSEIRCERVNEPKMHELHAKCVIFGRSGYVIPLSSLASQKELVWPLNGKIQGARVHFSRHNSPNSRALADSADRGSDPRSALRTRASINLFKS